MVGSGAGVPPFFPVEATVEELDSVDAILPGGLWLTNYQGAANVALLRKLKITHIAAVGAEFEDDNLAGFVYWKRNLHDTESQAAAMGSAMHDGAKFIHQAIEGSGRVLVHCAAGISRSSTLVLAYFLLHRKQSLHDAFREVIGRRRVVWPNDGFMGTLISLEKTLRGGEASIALEEYIAWSDYEATAAEIAQSRAAYDSQPALENVAEPDHRARGGADRTVGARGPR